MAERRFSVLAVREAEEKGRAFALLEYFRSGEMAGANRLHRVFAKWQRAREGSEFAWFSIGAVFTRDGRPFTVTLYRGVAEPQKFRRAGECIMLLNGPRRGRDFPARLQCNREGLHSLSIWEGVDKLSFDAFADELAKRFAHGNFIRPQHCGWQVNGM